MIKKLVLSLLIITAVGATGASATRALINDSAVLGTSTFSTGTVDLQISSTDGNSFSNGPVNGFTGSINPGTSKDYTVWLKNNTPDADFSLSGQAIDVVRSEGITNTHIKIAFTKVNVDGSVISGAPTVSKTMTSWSGGDPFGGSFHLAANTAQRYKMTVSLDDSAPAGTFSFGFQFTGTQAVPPTPTATPTP
jgi:hypothetical protein